jgi:hypothetical protein
VSKSGEALAIRVQPLRYYRAPRVSKRSFREFCNYLYGLARSGHACTMKPHASGKPMLKTAIYTLTGILLVFVSVAMGAGH